MHTNARDGVNAEALRAGDTIMLRSGLDGSEFGPYVVARDGVFRGIGGLAMVALEGTIASYTAAGVARIVSAA